MLRHDTQGGVNPQDTLASIPKAPPSPKISEEDVGIDEQKIKSELDDVKVKTEVDNYKPTEPDSKPSDELSSPLSKIDAVSITPPEIPCPVKEERHERDPDYGAELDSQASNSDSESKDPDFTLPHSSRGPLKNPRGHIKKRTTRLTFRLTILCASKMGHFLVLDARLFPAPQRLAMRRRKGHVHCVISVVPFVVLDPGGGGGNRRREGVR